MKNLVYSQSKVDLLIKESKITTLDELMKILNIKEIENYTEREAIFITGYNKALNDLLKKLKIRKLTL